ncbi:MAG: hypothetical protein GYA59_09950 [Chloroflexi bacterium]|jgi:hypothetical protein|nr:hypothetical protein [Chloroflexota bacterium]
MDENRSWKSKTLLIGAIIGALSGLVAAFLYIRRAEEQDNVPQLAPGEGIKLGLGILGLLRLISDFGEKN